MLTIAAVNVGTEVPKLETLASTRRHHPAAEWNQRARW